MPRSTGARIDPRPPEGTINPGGATRPRKAKPSGGLDAIIFTAGIGENAAPVRRAICAHLSWLGVEIDPAANDEHGTVINTTASKIDVLVIPTNEEAVIAGATRALVGA